jgi:hypothetical protein
VKYGYKNQSLYTTTILKNFRIEGFEGVPDFMSVGHARWQLIRRLVKEDISKFVWITVSEGKCN